MLTVTGLCHPDNPKINVFRLWRERVDGGAWA